MLPRSQRLGKTSFSLFFKQGKPCRTVNFLVKTAVSSGQINHYAAVAPKRVARTAVARNKIRRRVYSAIREARKDLDREGALSAIFIARNNLEAVSSAELKREVVAILKKPS